MVDKSQLSAGRSKEYRKFLKGETEQKKQSLYEKACNISEKILPISPWKSLESRYYDAIMFSHMKASPRGAFSLAILATVIAVAIPTFLAVVFGFFSTSTAMLIGILATLIFYYFYEYPNHFATIFRIKASTEMVLAIIYMTISMRISPNLENAIDFAAKNLSGALSTDLHQLLWDVYLRKYDSASTALDTFIEKWKKDNKEFAESMYLIKTSTIESTTRREHVLDEAVSVMLRGTKERMKTYSHELATPVTIINALGILLPVIGLIFLPMIGVFMPTTIQPIFIILGYNIMLPLIVYWMMKTYLDKRPHSFHNPDLSRHPKFSMQKEWVYPVIGVAVALPFIAIGSWQLYSLEGIFSEAHLMYSMLISFGVAVGISVYSILSIKNKVKIREEIIQIESEFAEVLFQLGNQLTRGIPFEKALKALTPQIKNLKVSKFFGKILYNIETFGMTLDQAVFDKKSGAIKEYPSKLIDAIMHAIIQISRRGMGTASKSMITISNYLKDSHSVDEDLKDMLGETTSTMSIQAMLLAPLSSAIVVSLYAVVIKVIVLLEGKVESIYGGMASYGALGDVGSGMFGSVLQMNNMIPIHVFQLIVSIYMIEVVGILAIILSVINNGDEETMKRLSLGKTVMLAFSIYAVVTLITYTLMGSLMPSLAGL